MGGPEMKSYWQCLLELPRLLEHGLVGVRSRQHPLYYIALRSIKTPSLVLPDMKVSLYIAIVQAPCRGPRHLTRPWDVHRANPKSFPVAPKV